MSSVLVVSLGRLGDMFGRVRMYNLGFAIYTVASLMLDRRLDDGPGGRPLPRRLPRRAGRRRRPSSSPTAAAILTDAFPENQRGLALGINNVAGISGSFIGLVVGRPAGPDRLAADLPRLGALRDLRHRLGLPEAARTGASGAGRRSTGSATSPSPSA